MTTELLEEPTPDPGIEETTLEHNGRTMDIVVYRPNASRFPVVIFSPGYNGNASPRTAGGGARRCR